MADVKKIPVDLLRPAPWNYKETGNRQTLTKLCRSIRKDESAGVLAVREIDGDSPGELAFEVIDGNHRLEAILELGWDMAWCENFGRISQPDAVLISRRRNLQWYADNKEKYSDLLNSVVIPEYSIAEIEEIMPQTAQEIEEDLAFTDILADAPDVQDVADPPPGMFDIKVRVPEEVFDMWQDWKQRLADYLEIDTEAQAFEFAIVEALNTPLDGSEQEQGTQT